MTAKEKPETNFNTLSQLAISKGGLLLSTKYNKFKKLKWQCNEGHIFWLTGYKVKRRGKWCLQCGASIGEREIRSFLRSNNISFIPQFILPMLPSRKYDFYFEYNTKKYLVEFDGEQHFYYVRKYHKSKEKFYKCQIIDRIKTYAAWNSGYNLIRIDYTQIEFITQHIIAAINLNSLVYLSNPIMYKYISDYNIVPEHLKLYA